MKIDNLKYYRCPKSGSILSLNNYIEENGNVISGELVSQEGIIYNIVEGIPDLTWPKELVTIDEETRKVYDKLANDYDKFASIPFQTYYSDEYKVRERMIDQLNINSGDTILEIGCGDGRGSEHIIKKLNNKGKVFLQELSPAFLKNAINRLKNYSLEIEFSIANACYLSFPDNFFDAAHHFGGINTFSDVKRCLSELARVVKPGGKVVIGDESMAPWLRETQFAKIMMNSNPLLKYNIPFESLPINAKDVKVEWIMMGAFFTIEFVVDVNEPQANYHINIPSERGGTHWTRYYGNLEGVTDEAKQLAIKSSSESGKSLHKWLDDLIKKNAHFID